MIIRPLTPEDLPLIESWIAAEPEHQNNTFEFYGQPNCKSVVYEDSQGPVFAIRYSSALRVDMEFPPDIDKERIRKMFQEGFPDVARSAKEQKFSEIVFNSVSKKLIGFLRAFGFEDCPDYRKTL